MDSQRVDMYLMTNAKFFQPQHLNYVRERLLAMDDSKWGMIQSVELKDPTTILIVSILAGGLGIDRFLIGDTGLGVAKLLTCGGVGIWTIIDWFLIMDLTRQKNMEKLQPFLG
ncbi:TM2 domain-containing protein [Flavobacterium sp. MFBS3-15]|uniref:TM2 domain-containing protein n=1 Tax=Flavobacterium sp. MFBS3-15 TaxID=2989816 RepID=UPI0022368BA6|nr:TM2 domain-containing protein [Flavobacterium sp. MFBS3-15]MCW4467825.1 TM2 domain-containing protein [Flavobacterium sp. MFBS3-15]